MSPDQAVLGGESFGVPLRLTQELNYSVFYFRKMDLKPRIVTGIWNILFGFLTAMLGQNSSHPRKSSYIWFTQKQVLFGMILRKKTLLSGSASLNKRIKNKYILV